MPSSTTVATAATLDSAIREVVSPGATIALGDGVGTLDLLDGAQSVGSALTALARSIGDLRLVLGWLPGPVHGIDPEPFRDIVALMPGWGVRALLDHDRGRFVPTRLSALRSVLSGPLRPDVLVTRLTRGAGGLCFGTEVSWQRELIAAGVPVIAVVDVASPAADAGEPLDPRSVRVVGSCTTGPLRVKQKAPEPIHLALADAVLRFIPAGARLQYGPGQLGTALLNLTEVPIRIDTGLLTDAVVDLDDRGKLIGTPSATYLLGTDRLYDWARDRPILHGIDHSHDLTRLGSGDPFVAVNTAIEVDPWGQINVEGVGSKVVGGIGGHPDYCAAAAMNPHGLSVIAVPSRYGEGAQQRSPLVDHLSRPASTPAYDVDLIVTEHGHADLRGADWDRRREMINQLFTKGSAPQ
jgi:hypothetical protein